MRKFIASSLFIALVACVSTPARAVELVANGGFETGDFTGWTVSPASSGSSINVDGVLPNSGSFDADFAASVPGDYDAISQNLRTVSDGVYNVSFWLANFDSDHNNDFQVYWEGTQILVPVLLNSDPFGYTQFTFSETAHSTAAQLLFQGYNVSSESFLDDVSVTAISLPVPEPSSFVLCGFGVAGLMLTGLRRHQVRT